MITLFQRAIAKQKAENGMELEAIYLLPELSEASRDEINQAVGLSSSSSYVPSINKPNKPNKPRDEFKSRIDCLYPSFTIRLSKELKDSLYEFARLENIKPAIITRLAIEEYLKNHIKSLNPAVRNLVKTKW